MNKICTSIDQSQKLIELGIDINTADMRYSPLNPDIPWVWVGKPLIEKDAIPAWSLSALMDVLDRGILFKTPQGWACQSYIDFKAITSEYYSNPIDACVEMILKLKENKII